MGLISHPPLNNVKKTVLLEREGFPKWSKQPLLQQGSLHQGGVQDYVQGTFMYFVVPHIPNHYKSPPF